tara:strand:+ start:39163 stop:40800 length:1638 start_codon:yes stop_codon:yes gene_type:complete
MSEYNIPIPKNDPIRSYYSESAERKKLITQINELKNQVIEIPLIIGGKEVRTGNLGNCLIPHKHSHILGRFHKAGEKELILAIDSAAKAWKFWSKTTLKERSKIYIKMAELASGKWRQILNASTILNMSKTVFQAEIDAACESVDFFNFNTFFAQELEKNQPLYSPPPTNNTIEYRSLEGFIFAVTPFNFTSIAANLPTAPSLMGNVVIWKPASSAVYPAWFLMQLFKEAGLPDGVINFIPGNGSQIGPFIMKHPDLSGVHFTGSTSVFQKMWETIGENISKYKSYPRLVGETGGKDFCIAHETAEIESLITGMIRGAFEFQGQKCSAMSRAYIPSNIWKKIKNRLIKEVSILKMGDPEDFNNFITAVIDQTAFNSIKRYIDLAKNSSDAEILVGGKCDDSVGYFIEPTIIKTKDPFFKTMEEEIFGPVLTIYIYEPADWEQTLKLIDNTSPYALTGCVFSKDEKAIEEAKIALRHSAGNFYINDKPTGAVVGQQPFGGGRASGTNDKAGSIFNLIRWVSQRTIKENSAPPKNYRYPYMEEKLTK